MVKDHLSIKKVVRRLKLWERGPTVVSSCPAAVQMYRGELCELFTYL